MAENCSSNDSLPFPQRSTSCIFISPNYQIIITYVCTHILVFLPICTIVFQHGLQQWRKKRSSSSNAPISHSDVFMYSSLIMELTGMVGCLVFFWGVYRKDTLFVLFGSTSLYFIWNVQNYFHVLTCIVRYLAVVRPVTYQSLKNRKGIRIRNASIACVAVVSFSKSYSGDYYIYFDCVSGIVSLVVISICSFSVIRVLVRPGPSKRDGGRKRVDQSKQRAFYTIWAILAVLVLRFSCNIALAVFFYSGKEKECETLAVEIWLNLPSSLVLPLLFLHKEGNLQCAFNGQRTNNV